MEERSIQEKELLAQIIDVEPPLPYRLVQHKTKYNGEVVMEDLVYAIPEEDKEELLQQLWPFTPVPSMDDEYLDIHEGKTMKIREYKVIRWGSRNLLVSKYYLKSGGCSIDLIKQDTAAGTCFISNIRNRKN